MSEEAPHEPPASAPDDARDALQRLDDAIATLGSTLREARREPRLDLTPVLQRRLQDRLGRREIDLVARPVDPGPNAGDLVHVVVQAAACIAEIAPARLAVRLDAGPASLRCFVGLDADLDPTELRERLDSPALADVRGFVDDRDGDLFVDARFDAIGLGWTIPR